MIIDAHSHMMNRKYFDRLIETGGSWSKDKVDKALAIAKRKPQFCDVSLRVEQLEKNGFTMQVITPHHVADCNLLPGDVAAQLSYAKALNNSMASLMEESKGRLIGVGTIPMAGFEQGSRQEMERAIKTLGLKAIGIVSNVNGKPVDSPEFEAFWVAADEMNVPIYIHPIDPAGTTGRSYEAEYDLIHNFGWPFETTLMLSRLVFSGTMERHPNLKIVSHHLGGGLIPFFWGRIQETYDPDNQKQNYGARAPALPKPPLEYFSRFFYDTAVGGSVPAIECAYKVLGADHIVFATDAPWGPGTGEFRLAEYPRVIESAIVSDEDRRKIFADNARLMLNLP